jgi:hypothetical protein
MKKVTIVINGLTRTVYMTPTAARQLVVDYESRHIDAEVHVTNI